MPSKAYGNFQKNLETVQRLNDTYEQMKKDRNSRGRGAFDHITRSAIVFLVSAFEVYCEDVLCEGVDWTIRSARDAIKLPNPVKNNINCFVKKETNGVPPTDLCDEGWRRVYKDMVEKQTQFLNTPSTKKIKELFGNFLGITAADLDAIPDFNNLDTVISFRGEIVHRVKATQYVHIEDVKAYICLIHNLAVNLDKTIKEHIRITYSVKAPWNDTYVSFV